MVADYRLFWAHENEMGDFVLHLDGWPMIFSMRAGGAVEGKELYANAPAGILGQGEWHDNTIRLTSLSTGFDQLHYGAMTVTSPRLALNKPIVHPRRHNAVATGRAVLWRRKTVFTAGACCRLLPLI